MTSPAVWDDAWARASVVAQALGLPLVDAAAQQTDDQADAWVLMETSAGSSSRAEMGVKLNEEQGIVWLHVMARSGSGTRPALVQRKALSEAFRFCDDLPAGLTYGDQSFDPPNTDDTGNWYRFSLGVDYIYQDIQVTA